MYDKLIDLKNNYLKVIKIIIYYYMMVLHCLLIKKHANN